jgi:hypothetical protein
VKYPEAKRGFVLLPRRWVVERSFAWAARFRRLARDYERLAATLAGYHWAGFRLAHAQLPLRQKRMTGSMRNPRWRVAVSRQTVMGARNALTARAARPLLFSAVPCWHLPS